MNAVRTSSLSVVAVALGALPCAAQSTLAWSRLHDAAVSQADYGRACAADELGNLLVVAKSYNPTFGTPPMPPTADIELVKWSPAGVKLWSVRRDVFGNDDTPLDVLCAPGGDVYVCGYGWNGNSVQIVLLKYDANGAFQWQRSHQGPGTLSAFGRGITLDGAGNVLLCGHESSLASGSNALVQCYSPAGVLLWSSGFDGGANGDDSCYALSVLASGEILGCGQFTGVSGGANVGVVRLSASGQVLAQRNDDGGGALSDGAAVLCRIDAQRFAVAGWRTGASSGEDWLVAVHDVQTLAPLWTRTFAGTSNAGERARGVHADARGALWVMGPATNLGSGIDTHVRRYDFAGNLLSSDGWNGAAGLDDPPFKLLAGSAGQLYVAGYSQLGASPTSTYAMSVLSYDETGVRNWAATYTTPGASDARIFEAALTPQGALVAGGYSSDGALGGFDVLGMRVDLAASPQAYCTAKVNSLGCTPTFSFAGLSSAAATSGFTTFVRNLRNQKSGLYFYSLLGAAAAPFQGGWYCVQTPVRRAPLGNTGGTLIAFDDCTGVLALDWNAFAHGLSGAAPAPELLTPGTSIWCQAWSRDPGASFQTNLSAGLSFRVLP